MSDADPKSANPPPQFFTNLASDYAYQTGDATRAIILDARNSIMAAHPVTADSVIHDNGGGVGTVTSVILDALPKGATPSILITDVNAAMVTVAKSTFKKYEGRIRAEEMDTQALTVPASHFTHSILNFAIFVIPQPVEALRAMYRSLRPGGLAVITTWKRFGFSGIVHAAQARVRPDLAPMPLPGARFCEDGALARMVVEAGFPERGVQVLEKKTLRTGEHLQGLRKFVKTGVGNMATKEWTPEQKALWPEAAEKAIDEEVRENGGMLFSAWVILAKKEVSAA